MRRLFSLLFILVVCLAYGHEGNVIVLEESGLGLSHCTSVGYLRDDSNKYVSIDDVLNLAPSAFTKGEKDILNFNFQRGVCWLSFSVMNKTDQTEFIIETGSTVMNEVRFYEIGENENVVNEFISGDDFNYDDKKIKHRKNIFPLSLEKGETKKFFLKLRSDGGLLYAPLIVHSTLKFYEEDEKSQFRNGFYYGLIVLIVIIYFFFFIYLEDKTFLFYILYVFLQGMLQFSLDGYAHDHFFSSGGYLPNHIILFLAGVMIIFLLIYVSNFLSLKKVNKTFYRFFKWCSFLIGGLVLLSFIPGRPYELAFPLINGANLLSALLAAFTIVFLRVKGEKVDFFFMAAFFILVIGGVIFVLGNLSIIGNKEISFAALKVGSALEFVVLSVSMSSRYGKLQKEKDNAQKAAVESLKERNDLMDEINIRLEKQVKERTEKVEKQKEELTISKESIVSSIKYAKRIQEAILPSEEQVKALLPNSFVFYKPKDVVSGDFYFVEPTRLSDLNNEPYTVFAAVDCTGHGVPGAFMSIVGNNFLTQSLSEEHVKSPAQALGFLNRGVSKTLKQAVIGGSIVRDGMDIALCAISEDRKRLLFAGAKNMLYIMRSKEGLDLSIIPEAASIRSETEGAILFEIKGDKFPIGNVSDSTPKSFTDHEIQLVKGDHIVIFTDGFVDQFGGDRHKKFNYTRFRSALLENFGKPINEQESSLIHSFDNWQQDAEQIDDVLVMMVKV